MIDLYTSLHQRLANVSDTWTGTWMSGPAALDESPPVVLMSEVIVFTSWPVTVVDGPNQVAIGRIAGIVQREVVVRKAVCATIEELQR